MKLLLSELQIIYILQDLSSPVEATMIKIRRLPGRYCTLEVMKCITLQGASFMFKQACPYRPLHSALWESRLGNLQKIVVLDGHTTVMWSLRSQDTRC